SYSIILMNFVFIEVTTAFASILTSMRFMRRYVYFGDYFASQMRCLGSKRFCFVAIAWMFHGYSHYMVLLALSFCFRYYVIEHAVPRNIVLVCVLIAAYIPSVLVYVSLCFIFHRLWAC
ncbi:hypothetical protein PMAYCL1PPCAC_16477, partial [Pristionchus mayeri]